MKHQVEKLMRPKQEQSWAQRFREITARLAKGAQGYDQGEIDKTIDEGGESGEGQEACPGLRRSSIQTCCLVWRLRSVG